MPETTLPQLGTLSARLAGDNARLGQFVDSVAGRIDKILRAIQEKNWREAERLSHWLARSSAAHGQATLSQRADALGVELTRPHNALGVRQRLMSLIEACGNPDNAGEGSASRSF